MSKKSKRILIAVLALVILLIGYGALSIFGIVFGNSVNEPIRNLALKLKFPAICNLIFLGEFYDDYGISAQKVRYYCKAEIAGATNNIDYCYSLDGGQAYSGSASQQYVCFKSILEKAVDIDTCDKLPLESYPVSPRYECYTRIAELNSDPSICDKTPETGYDRNYRGSKKNCLIAVGKKLKSTKVCQNLSDSYVTDECIYAVENN